MATYVVMEPPGASDARSGDAVFARDGFHFFAFLVPVVWLLWHRLWIEAALVLAAQVILAAGAELAGAPMAGAAASLALSIWAGLEGPALRIAALRRRGWSERGTVEGQSLEEAEARYFLAGAGADAAETFLAVPEPRRQPVAPPLPDGPALGLMAYPDRR